MSTTYPITGCCCVALALLGCLRPSQERAERDARVGRAENASYSVQVDQGHAAIRDSTEDSLTLWASAPTLNLTLDFAEPRDRFELRVHNCMPGVSLRTEASVAFAKEPHELPTRCDYSLSSVPNGEIQLRLQPPGAKAPTPFRFALLSDIQEAIDEVQDIFRTLNQQTNVDFLLGAGDLTRRGSADELERFQRELERLDIPYYTTLGNHELGVWPARYHDYFGRSSYSFGHHGVHFTLLDSGSATLDPLIYQRLQGWLRRAKAAPHVVAMHVPPLDPVGVRNGAFASRNEAAKLLGMLAQHEVDLTLYGHIHSYYAFDNAGIPAHISGGGGAIPERFDGIGRHFLIFDVEPENSSFDVSVVRVD